MPIYLIAVVVVALVLLLAWWSHRLPPDDPWMLEHGHRLAHHHLTGMEPGSVDHAQQETAADQRDRRDARLSAVRLAHTDGPRLRLEKRREA